MGFVLCTGSGEVLGWFRRGFSMICGCFGDTCLDIFVTQWKTKKCVSTAPAWADCICGPTGELAMIRRMVVFFDCLRVCGKKYILDDFLNNFGLHFGDFWSLERSFGHYLAPKRQKRGAKWSSKKSTKNREPRKV